MFGFIGSLVLLTHLLFVLFAVLGGWLLVRWPKLVCVHLPAAAWAAWIEFSGWTCPLTPLENRLRGLAGEATYQDDFLHHYLIELLYPHRLTRPDQWALGAAVLLVNAGAYWRWWKAVRRTTTRAS